MIFRIALCQMPGVEDKKTNMETAEKMVREAAENGAEIISLPEIWPCLYSKRYFRANAETADGPLVQAMSGWAAENSIYLVGGSIPLLRGDDMYNTCFVFGREGDIIAVHEVSAEKQRPFRKDKTDLCRPAVFFESGLFGEHQARV